MVRAYYGQLAKCPKGVDFCRKVCEIRCMEKEILLLEPELWTALHIIYTEGLAELPYADDTKLAEQAFDIFAQVPTIDYQPAEVPLDVFRFLQQFAEECYAVFADLLSAEEQERVSAFIAE